MADDFYELMIEQYAKSKGMDKEEARRQLLPILRSEKKPDMTNKLAETMAVADTIAKTTQLTVGADPLAKDLISSMLIRNVVGTMGRSEEKEESLEDMMKRITKTTLAFKLVTEAINQSGGSPDTIKKLEETIKGLNDKIDNKKAQEDLVLIEKKLQEIINPLAIKYTELEKRMVDIQHAAVPPPPPPQEPLDIFEQIVNAQTKSQTFMEKMGFEVKPKRGFTEDELNKAREEGQKEAISKVPLDTMKKKLEDGGYDVSGGPVSRKDLVKLLEDEKDKAKQEAYDDKRIETTQKLVESAISQILQMFGPAIRQVVEGAVTSMVTGGGVPSATAPPTGSSIPQAGGV